MPKRSKKSKDVIEIAHDMMEAIASGSIPKTPEGKDPLAVALGRRGGLKGGPARIAMLDADERKELAKKAARARWGRKK
jgi:hypothetical protein